MIYLKILLLIGLVIIMQYALLFYLVHRMEKAFRSNINNVSNQIQSNLESVRIILGKVKGD